MTITRDVIAHHYAASPESVRAMFDLPTDEAGLEDGRSEWRWFRTTDGDLIFGCFPTGEGYFATEGNWEADYIAADKAGKVGVLLGDEHGAPQVPYGPGITPRWADAVLAE